MHILLLFLTLLPVSLPAQQFLAGWKYSQALHIQPQQNLTDFQVSFDINTLALIEGGKMHPTGQDIRVTDSDGKTFLCYWLEGNVYDSLVKLWVKVPVLRAQEEKVIYLHYGNPQAEKIADGACTFLLFDDFEGDALNQQVWDWYGGGTLEIRNSQAHISATGQDLMLRSVQSFNLPIIVEMKVDASEGKYTALALLKDSDIFRQGYALSHNQIRESMQLTRTDAEASPCGGFSFLPFALEAVKAKQHTGIWSLAWITRHHIFATWDTGSLIEENSFWTIENLKVALGALACKMNSETQTAKLVVDWVRIRRFAQQPPQVLLGYEESDPSIGVLDFRGSYMG